jgi:hypothetical protein
MTMIQNNVVYSITAKHSGKVLAVSQASQSDGTNVIQYDWQNGGEQKWLEE